MNAKIIKRTPISYVKGNWNIRYVREDGTVDISIWDFPTRAKAREHIRSTKTAAMPQVAS